MSALSEFMMCPLIIGTPIHQFNHRAGHSTKGPSINYVVLVGGEGKGGGRDLLAETIEWRPLCITDLFQNKSVAYF